MSFRSRILERNTLPRATFAPNLQFKEVDGVVTVVPLTELEIEQERRLYDDVKPSTINDSGLPLQQFHKSPDGSRDSQEMEMDADCKVTEQVLTEQGYDLSKPMKGQKVNQSQQTQTQSTQETKVEQTTTTNNEQIN